MAPAVIRTLKHTKSGSNAEISDYGATVLSFQDAMSGRSNNLFVSSTAVLDGSKPIRGGIPLVFPIFGPPDDPNSTMPQHGFARKNTWTLQPEASFDNEESAAMTFQLDFKDVEDGQGTNNIWERKADSDYDCSLIYTIEISADKMKNTLTVKNTGKASFPFQALFHTYYKVDDGAALNHDECYVKGLEGYSVQDKVTKTEGSVGVGPVVISGEVDRVYHPPTGTTDVDVVIGVGGGGRTVSLSTTGEVNGTSVPVSCVVWNPSAQKAQSMPDFTTEQYIDMICVEPGILGNPVLEVGKHATMAQVIHVNASTHTRKL